MSANGEGSTELVKERRYRLCRCRSGSLKIRMSEGAP